MNTKVLKCHICIADGRRQLHGWVLVGYLKKEKDFFLDFESASCRKKAGVGPQLTCSPCGRVLANQTKLRIVSAPIGQRKAEAMPTCRGCVPIRNFASPTSSTSNLAFPRHHARFRIRPLPPAHTMIAQRAGTTALRRGTHALNSICQFNWGSSELRWKDDERSRWLTASQPNM